MRVQFGPFVMDTERARLLKHGVPLRLRDQPFQILAALLERPGEIVTREELRRRLWRDDVFVDFDVGLNSSISRLRQVLGDSAEAPRLIETVPKRGYRFIGPVARRPSLAVMPFVNHPPDPENEYFSDGLTDELIRALSQIDGLRVAARSLVSRYKNGVYDLKQAGREMGVESLLEGSVRRISRTVRINVHLVNVDEGVELWSQCFDTEWNDVFAVQDRVSQGIAEALKLRLSNRRPADRAHNAEAYAAYLKGHHLIKRHTPGNAQRALAYFQESICLDPGYALPYHGAALYYILGVMMGELSPGQALEQGEDLLRRGLSLDENSSMLQNTLGMMRMFQWRWEEAEVAYQRALGLEPSNPHVRMMYALLCSFLGRHEDALQHAGVALDLDPLDPMTNFRMVQACYYARQYERAVQTGRTAIELAPEFPYSRWYMAWSLLALDRNDEAWEMANRARALGGRQPLNEGHFGYVAGMAGHPPEAQSLVTELLARRRSGYSPALPIAWTHLGLGATDACLEWLETAVAEREPYLGSITVFPGYDRLRGHARFKDLVRRVHDRSLEPL